KTPSYTRWCRGVRTRNVFSSRKHQSQQKTSDVTKQNVSERMLGNIISSPHPTISTATTIPIAHSRRTTTPPSLSRLRTLNTCIQTSVLEPTAVRRLKHRRVKCVVERQTH
ncbi:unnamed protein product, partial [Ectocarpus sp. 13 AM-2016]